MSHTFALFALLAGSSLLAAETPQIVDLQVQRHKDTTYFSVSLRPPAKLWLPDLRPTIVQTPSEGQRRHLARLPQLIPQDEGTAAVYCDVPLQPNFGADFSLHFIGKVHGQGKAQLLFTYPMKRDRPRDAKPTLAPPFLTETWGEIPVTLDFSRATKIAPCKGVRRAGTFPHGDLEGQWALAQVRQLAVFEAQAPESGFYPLARTLTGRKYQVKEESFVKRESPPRGQEFRRFYEMTTGAAALTESLALHRLREASGVGREKRTVAVDSLLGINVGEHPWQKMMAGKKPVAEPLAEWTPHDQYYVTFRSIRALLECGDLLDQWGGNILNAYKISGRDYQIRQRYEKQLCIQRTDLARTLGPAIIREVALTGSDPYLREGSDVTLIFHVTNRALFLAAVEPFIAETRKEFGDRLRESKSEHKGTTIENFVTPLREVSLHRAVVGDYVIFSNSPVAVRRVLDTHAGRYKSLAQSLDFRYMRTVFRRDDKQEDGFAFLSDAFIRQLVGPGSKIKEKRRLEALTSLRMVTDAALFAAWETGRLPTDHKTLLAESGLKPEEIETPEGKGVVWDGKQRVAISDAYNTLNFATPLLELPIDKVTEREERDYEEFRSDYLDLWRRYFDPVGMRLLLRDNRIRVETYILPLIDGAGYNALRQWTGDRTTTIDAATFSPKSLVQFTAHLAPHIFPNQWYARALGDQFVLRCDDSSLFRRLAKLWVRQELEAHDKTKWEDEVNNVFFQLPLSLGVRIGEQKKFVQLLKDAQGLFSRDNPEPLKPPYKGVTITRLPLDTKIPADHEEDAESTDGKKRFTPALYHAKIEGMWYASFSLDSIREEIDRSVDRREGQLTAKEKVKINSSIYVAPEAAFQASGALRAFLEWETHRRAVGNGPLWYALRRAGVVNVLDSDKSRQTALHYLGFVPVSSDNSPYHYNGQTDDLLNDRHGSLSRPMLHDRLSETSPLAQLLDQLRTLRVDLRFREDGVHTILTVDRVRARAKEAP
jgi:hypothetical protein